ncbi:probable G-protein coupled receptor 139 [Stegostoma tigrinum]|uniref:probable G-protein coupled receptor 139 n=1 Tax=Stegostoma tigrinum TaxID=3053191 RepID=UPI002870A82B|nr:probable G-protein coupled receptor 139 [Stegostoma tigrinum]
MSANLINSQSKLSYNMERPIVVQISDIYYPFLATVGVPANVLTIIVLARGNCGLSKCITCYLLSMTVADFLVLLFDVILYEIKNVYFPYSFLNHTPICSLNLVLIFASIDCSVWFTVAFTFDRFVAICCQKLQTKYCTERTAVIMIGVVTSLSVLQSIPVYFVYVPREIIDNVPWSCYVKTSFYTSPLWAALMWLRSILTPFIPFILILLLNALTIRNIILASRVRRGLRGNKTVEKHNDPEMENRRKSIILLLAISGSFILLWIVTLISYVCVHFAEIQFLAEDYNSPFTILEQSGYMLSVLSSCTNTFIYAVSQRKFRHELYNIFKHPLNLIISLFK